MAVSELGMIKLIGKTDVGRKRPINEDAFRMGTLGVDAAYAVLCDGMGGHLGGNVASAKAVNIISGQITRSYNSLMSEQTIKMVLKAAVSAANAIIYDKGKKDESLSNMGTTLEIALIVDHVLFAVHVGDSRIYLIRHGQIRQLTVDHTTVQMMVELGKISKEEARTHPDKHYITKALGVLPDIKMDFFQESLVDGDIILLCSDGLTNHLTDGDILSIVQSDDDEDKAQLLIQKANALGGSDNITVTLMYCLEDVDG